MKATQWRKEAWLFIQSVASNVFLGDTLEVDALAVKASIRPLHYKQKRQLLGLKHYKGRVKRLENKPLKEEEDSLYLKKLTSPPSNRTLG